MSEPADKQLEAAVTDVGAERIARVYAEALYNAAAASGQAADILGDLNALTGEVFRGNPELEQFLSGSATGRDQRSSQARIAALSGPKLAQPRSWK